MDSTKDDPEFIHKTWLRSKFNELVKSLVQVLLAPQSEDALRVRRLCWTLKDSGRFHSATYHKLLHSIVHSPESVNFVTELFALKYFKYIDVRQVLGIFYFFLLVRLFFLYQSRKACWRLGGIRYFRIFIQEGDLKAGSELSKAEHRKLTTEKDNNEVLSAATISKKMKLKFTEAWISFLRLHLPIEIYRQEDGNESEKDYSKAQEIADIADGSITVRYISARKPGIDHFIN
ncbi:protein NUCLEOLAR COMPLEX ASSOCIATED 4-like [Mangifera indica]|uniref:protein NUCLEOLAR COMPLEX ASSOCIATED 4-like n=1 Tax=Mangifera indica TaxID=29780 RepID=UPI001CF9CADA|nr:protein NUCLEOLAR COMPLEX ASSOCIATED 4-like [Mangifera indica]XP_044488945.1 protein NUCLEOLAR COMPLEX ASSOCIATED 4-like [Mangifera indica]